MNIENGEIRRYTDAEMAELKKNPAVAKTMIELTAGEAETLEELPPKIRLKAYANWKDKEKMMRFTNRVVKIQRKQDFLEGFVIGWLVAQEKE